MAVLLARRQARTFSTGLICGAWGGSGMSVMLSGTRSALAPCRRVGLGAFGTDGAKDAGPFASGIARRPAGRHALCASTTPRFSCRAPHRAGRPVPWRQSFQTPPGPAGRISGGRTERRRNPSAANCLPCVPASSHPSAFRPRVADRHAASRQHRAFPDRGLRGRARQARPSAPRRGVGHAPAPGKPLKTSLVVAMEPIP